MEQEEEEDREALLIQEEKLRAEMEKMAKEGYKEQVQDQIQTKHALNIHVPNSIFSRIVVLYSSVDCTFKLKSGCLHFRFTANIEHGCEQLARLNWLSCLGLRFQQLAEIA